MAELSGVFADSPLDAAEDLARLLRQFAPSGVVTTRGMSPPVDAGDELEITANGTGLITLGTGFALVGGYWYRVTAPITLPVTANTSSQARRDLVVVRADPTAGAATATILPGTPGAGSAPSPSREGAGVWDVVLGVVTVAGNSSVVVSGDVDLRPREFTSASGAVPCLSTNRPPVPHRGMVAWETDTRRVMVWTGSTWATVSETQYPTDWQSIELRSGFTYGGSGSRPEWRWVRPGSVELRGTISRMSGAGIETNNYIGRMPAAARPNANRRYVGASAAHTTGYSVRMEVKSTYQGVNSENAGRIWVYTDGKHAPIWVSLDGWFYDVS
ncbi:hypothetical protein [Nocardiopsis sp. FR26]|uniref:hypothetical protein n=1 Tax=Nocardiopsis sp. FR26 TaxID=2605987 RepID=UPI00135B815F|nr:hypothetical protein [Nocardiopsis sp. FR26]